MSKIYRAKLHGDKIEWIDKAPEGVDGVEVEIVVSSKPTFPDEKSRGAAMAAAFRKLAELKAFSEIKDPVEWQREIRRDRPLPGREE